MARRKRQRRTSRTLFDDVGAVAEVIHIPGKGIRCKDTRGKFTSCLAGDVGDLGALGKTGTLSGRRRGGSRREYIPTVGYRCRYTSGPKKGKFKKCR